MEPTFQEAKAAVDALNSAFAEFKRTNDARLEQIESRGVVDPIITQKLDKLNDAMDAQSAINDKFIEVRSVVERLATMGIQTSDAQHIEEKTVENFNLTLRAQAISAGRVAPTAVGAAELRAYNEAYAKYLKSGKQDLTDVERRALSVGSDVNGGYLVSPDLSGRIVARVYETSPMRQYASAQTIATDTLRGSVDLEEASFGWVSELGARTESNTPVVPAPWTISVNEAFAEPRISQQLVEDANTDIVEWLARKVGDKFGRGYNTAFVVGTGVGQPRGFASYTTAATADGSRAWGTFEHIATGASGAFGTDPAAVNNLVDMIHALKDHFVADSAFYMTRLTLGALRKETDASTTGRFVFIPSFQAGLPDTVMGFPVRKLQDMATIGANSLSIAFGNMSECYQIVDRLGITTLVDPYTAKPEIKYYTRGRVGGDVVNFEAMKFLRFA